MIIARPLSVAGNKYTLDIYNLKSKYPTLCQDGVQVRGYINRVYNENRKIVNQPRMYCAIEIVKIGSWEKLDLTPFAVKLGIPQGYTIEVLAINFVIQEEMQVIEVPIFPNEIQMDVSDTEINARIKEEMESLMKISETFETIGLLYEKNFFDLASDLREGLIRTEKNDHEGAIKFYRKTIEGFKLLMRNKIIDDSESRTKEIKEFLSKAYSLLSNFGEHYGTRGFIDEGNFARDLTVAISRYMIKKL
jgi:hypothetical protein